MLAILVMYHRVGFWIVTKVIAARKGRAASLGPLLDCIRHLTTRLRSLKGGPADRSREGIRPPL